MGGPTPPDDSPTAEKPAKPDAKDATDDQKLREGWKKIVPIPDPMLGKGDQYIVWVEDGWLHAKTDLCTLHDYDGPDLLEAWSRMNRDFLARGWSDGFPLVAPTGRAVEAMLRGTARDPGEVIATLEPGFGLATVEKLAISAVMAGGGPEHLPLLVAAVRCLAEPKMYLRNKAMSTGPHAPLPRSW